MFDFLGAFTKFRKGAITVVVSICPYVRLVHLGSHQMDFHEI